MTRDGNIVTPGQDAVFPPAELERRMTAARALLAERDIVASCHDRYHAALMRCAWVGEPPAEARRMMDVCLEGLEAALSVLRPGRTCADVHAACQAVIDASGYTQAFRKRLGYSVGISFAPDWGEGQVLSLYTGVEVTLEPGMAFHVVPALRRYGEFTVCASETVVVTGQGHRVLGSLPRDMRIV